MPQRTEVEEAIIDAECQASLLHYKGIQLLDLASEASNRAIELREQFEVSQ